MEPSKILTIAHAEQERARSIIAGLRPCPIMLSRATTLLGTYQADQRTNTSSIRISRYLSDEAQVRDTVRHELAHQAAYELHGHLGHGPVWQTWATYLGCVPKACSHSKLAVTGHMRYALVCRLCGWKVLRQRRSKAVRQPRRFACARCRGPLTVAELNSS